MKRIFELDKEQERRALDLHKEATIIDSSIVMNPDGKGLANGEYFKTLIDAGITASFDMRPFTSWDATQQAMKNLYKWYRLIEKYPDKIVLANDAEDIVEAKRNKKWVYVAGLQSPEPIQNDLTTLPILYKLGIRVMLIAYNKRNYLGDGCLERGNSGLSDFGLKAIEEMNRLGILIDLAHSNDATTSEAIEASKDPTIFSHANPRSICPHRRNKTDEQIKAMAEKGGVIGIVPFAPFTEVKKGVRPTFEDYLYHMEYAIKLVGVDHVGMGQDLLDPWYFSPQEYVGHVGREPEIWQAPGGLMYDYSTRRIDNFDKIEDTINLTKGLVAKGYSDEEIKKILGQNLLRVLRKVWKKKK